METELTSARLVKTAYDKLKASDAISAYQYLEQALNIDFENEEIKYALKCVSWWLGQAERTETMEDPYEKGVFLIAQFRHYHVFLEQFDNIYDQCQYAMRCFVYSTALRYFEGGLNNQSSQNDHGLLLLTGRCYKGIGNYDEALGYIEKAIHLKKEDAETLAELADVHALLAETKSAKALFREAFFLDPSGINICFLESELILRLRDKVAELGYSGNELSDWIPVYGHLFGVFSVKRELKQVEAGRLKQSIFSLETEREANPGKRDALKPRLLNRYFWLIDHYENNHEDPALIEETLLKIKVTDPEIFRRYTE
jgi:hypothetical protein